MTAGSTLWESRTHDKVWWGHPGQIVEGLVSPVGSGVQEIKEWLRQVFGKRAGRMVDWRRRQLGGCPVTMRKAAGGARGQLPVNLVQQPG